MSLIWRSGNRLRKHQGFTLMELLVAMVLAALLSLTAFTFLQQTWSSHHHLVESYWRSSSVLLDHIRSAHPYGLDKRRRINPTF
ncbi:MULTISPECIES: type II secretion system protein J [unclassified Fibrobacter]|uniref:PulJ/GspJ family protein n=1 Tax=unclassified Fibrobacter TaxID=2634177 RepID=UPI000D6DA113|nr:MULTISPECIES: prepilin-type N-terminal cleavage/methylation domain-containing protein [unclassified Fibrobacter]